MIIQRRNFLIGLASSLAAPAIVKAANIMPVKVFKPVVSMQEIVNYVMNANVKLDVLYGRLKIGDRLNISYSEDEFIVTAISPNELYHE